MARRLMLVAAIFALLLAGCTGKRVVKKNVDGSVAKYYLNKDGQMHGRWVLRYPNGLVFSRGNFFNGKPHGLWQMWNMSRRRIKFETYRYGLVTETVTEPIAVGEFMKIPKK